MHNLFTLALLGLHIVASTPMALATSADEHTRLALLLEQLRQVEALSDEAKDSASQVQHERYAFDYPRFTHDLERLREGITDYLHPSRAQPRDPVELSGNYRRESPEAQP
ncbi:integrative conjugative element protein, RAQPRD family [Pseudomonas sp. B392_1p]|uniref:integrative conjugative element protein, RAQPRD family n=1 Tax=Pseudomonas sp. B392_1p TaxID=3457507 RepID=UPI003FCEF526